MRGSAEWFQKMIRRRCSNAMATWLCAGNPPPEGVSPEDVLRTFVGLDSTGRKRMATRQREKLLNLLGKGVLPDAMIRDTICQSGHFDAVVKLAEQRPDLLPADIVADHVSLDEAADIVELARYGSSRRIMRQRRRLADKVLAIPGMEKLLTVKEVLES